MLKIPIVLDDINIWDTINNNDFSLSSSNLSSNYYSMKIILMIMGMIVVIMVKEMKIVKIIT